MAVGKGKETTMITAMVDDSDYPKMAGKPALSFISSPTHRVELHFNDWDTRVVPLEYTETEAITARRLLSTQILKGGDPRVPFERGVFLDDTNTWVTMDLKQARLALQEIDKQLALVGVITPSIIPVTVMGCYMEDDGSEE